MFDIIEYVLIGFRTDLAVLAVQQGVLTQELLAKERLHVKIGNLQTDYIFEFFALIYKQANLEVIKTTKYKIAYTK